MGPTDLLTVVASVCERLGIPYRAVGSMAASLYGEPRSTNDVDVVVQLDAANVDAFCASFPEPEYYCSLDAARNAVRKRFQFNILHLTSGLKVDVIQGSDSPFDRARFSRGKRLPVDDLHEVWFAAPEDVILKKLDFFREGGSEKHLRDVVGILKVQAGQIDDAYLAQWIARLKLEVEWRLVTDRMRGSP